MGWLAELKLEVRWKSRCVAGENREPDDEQVEAERLASGRGASWLLPPPRGHGNATVSTLRHITVGRAGTDAAPLCAPCDLSSLTNWI